MKPLPQLRLSEQGAHKQRITSSEVCAWTLSVKGKILWVDLVEDAEDPEPQFEGPQNCRVRTLVVGCILGLLTSRRGGL